MILQLKRSALLKAVANGHLETVKYLIGEGLDPNDRDEVWSNVMCVHAVLYIMKYLFPN